MITTKKNPAHPLGDVAYDVQDRAGLEGLFVTSFVSRFEAGGEWRYKQLTLEYCRCATPIFISCRTSGLRPWILYFTRARDVAEWAAKLPNFSLSKIVADLGFTVGGGREIQAKIDQRSQRVGIFEINWNEISDACEHQSHNPGVLLIFSSRNLCDHLDKIHDFALQPLGAEFENTSGLGINWYAIAVLLCPYGDIVAKTWGGFDDRERTLDLMYSKFHISPAVLEKLEAAEPTRATVSLAPIRPSERSGQPEY